MSDSKSLPGWLLPVGLAVLVGGLVTIALLRGPVELDPDTAEGAVQEYLLAVREDRWEDAIAVVHIDALGECTASDMSRFDPGPFTAELGAPGGIGFAQTFPMGEDPVRPVPEGDEIVDVTIHRDAGGGLGSGWDEYVRFELTDDGDFWWITGDPWPYFVWQCRGN